MNLSSEGTALGVVEQCSSGVLWWAPDASAALTTAALGVSIGRSTVVCFVVMRLWIFGGRLT